MTAALTPSAMNATTIHQRIRQCRIQSGMTMVELARAVGVTSWQTIQQWENGGTAPSRAQLPAVANALQTTEVYLTAGVKANALPAVAKILMGAQEILAAADSMMGPSKADTIKALNDLLRGPLANAALTVAMCEATRDVAQSMIDALRLPAEVQS